MFFVAGDSAVCGYSGREGSTVCECGCGADRRNQTKDRTDFDDGPSAAYTEKLLDGLRERDVHATFFLIGENIEKGDNALLVRQMARDGHLIGNHTYHHVEITKLSDEEAMYEINKTDELIAAITGQRVQYIRPPFGVWKRELENYLDVLPVMWTVDPLDWTTENADEVVNKVVSQAKENDIILFT